MSPKSQKNSNHPVKFFLPHMQRINKIILKNLSYCDMIIEILDARAPLITRNKKIVARTRDKKRIIILNKSDLADPLETQKWMKYFKNQEKSSGQISSNLKLITSSKLLWEIKKKSQLALRNKKWWRKRPIRFLILGIPNVGKSSFINKLLGKKKNQVGDTPGVTRGEKLIRLKEEMVFIDTPGILEEMKPEENFWLEIIGSKSDSSFNKQDLVENFINYLIGREEDYLRKAFNLNSTVDFKNYFKDNNPLLEYARQKNFIIRANWNLDRAANDFLRKFRKAAITRLTLQKVSNS